MICSQYSPTKWTFTTIEVPYGLMQDYDGEHPVSGNREFGIEQNPDGTYTFYTRGVDRFTSGLQEFIAFKKEYYENNNKDPFAPADQFWQGLHIMFHWSLIYRYLATILCQFFMNFGE